MSEEFILEYLPERLKQLGYSRYNLRYRDLFLEGNSSITFRAYTDLWFVIDDPPGIIVESSYGVYDSTGNYFGENTHEHKGEIVITNPDSDSKKIKFIEAIIIS